MHLEYVARRAMKPGQNDQRIPHGDPVKGQHGRLRDVYPSVWCAFVALARGSLESCEIRPDKANRLEGIAGISHILAPLHYLCTLGSSRAPRRMPRSPPQLGEAARRRD